MSYRYKPVTVEAFVFDERSDRCCPEWFQTALAKERVIINWRLQDGAARIYGCTFYNAKGKRTTDAFCGDYIIREPTGEIRKMRKKDFEIMFEKEG